MPPFFPFSSSAGHGEEVASEGRLAGRDERKWKWRIGRDVCPGGRQLVANLTVSSETQAVQTGRKSAKKKLRLRLLCGCMEVRAISVTRSKSFYCIAVNKNP